VTTTDGDGQAIIPAPLSPTQNDNQKASPKATLNDCRRVFKQIIVKCVLQLLLIETTNDLLRNDEVYRTIPPEHLLRDGRARPQLPVRTDVQRGQGASDRAVESR